MQVTVNITYDDLTQAHKDLLCAGRSEYGTSVMTHDERQLRAANDLVKVGLLSDDGLLYPDYRHRQYHTTLTGRAFLREAKERDQ